MEKKKVILILILLILFTGSAISSYNKSAIENEGISKPETENFRSFLAQFTSSASFQYARVKFPLETPIVLLTSEGEEESFPFTKEEWPLLNSEAFKEGRVVQEEDGIYVAGFVVDEPARKEFEAGYEESELVLRIVFELKDGKWYVTDCYNAWYSFDLSVEELEETVFQVQEENRAFEEKYP